MEYNSINSKLIKTCFNAVLYESGINHGIQKAKNKQEKK